MSAASLVQRALAVAATLAAAWGASGVAPVAAAPTAGPPTEGFFTSGALALEVNVPAGPDRYLLLAVATAGSELRVRSASHAGAALGFIGRSVSPGGNCQVEWWGLVAPAEGTQPFQVALSGETRLAGATVIPYRGVAARGAVGRFVEARGGSGPALISVPGVADEVLLDAVCGWGADSVILDAGPGQRAFWHWSTGSLSTAGSGRPAGDNPTLSWTASGPGGMEWAAAALSLRPAGGTVSLPLKVETAGCSVPGGGAAAPGPGWLVIVWGLAWGAARARRGRAGNLGRPMACNRKGPCVQVPSASLRPRTAIRTSTR